MNDLNLIFTCDWKGRKEKCKLLLDLIEKEGIEAVLQEITSIAKGAKK